MSGLPLMRDAFATAGPSAAAGAAADRATGGHRRSSGDAEAFAEIVTSLGRSAPGRAETPAAATAPAASGPLSVADALETASRLEATPALDPAATREPAPAHPAPTVPGGAAALVRSTPSGAAASFGSGLGAGLQAALAGATAPTAGDPAPSDVRPPDAGALSLRPSADHDGRTADRVLPGRQPPVAARDGCGLPTADDPAQPDAAVANGPSGEEASPGAETSRTDTVDAGAERAPRLDTIAQPPAAAGGPAAAVIGPADAGRDAVPLPVPPASHGQSSGAAATPSRGDAASAIPGAPRPGRADAAPVPAESAARLPGAAPSHPAGPAAVPDDGPAPKAAPQETAPRPAMPTSAREDRAAARPMETGTAPSAHPAATATQPLGSDSAADAPARSPEARGGRVAAQVRDMRTYFAPVTARTITATGGARPEGAAATAGVPAAAEATAAAVEAETARALGTPPTAPVAPTATAAPTAPPATHAGLVAAAPPTGLEAPGPTGITGNPQPASSRGSVPSVPGDASSEAADLAASPPDQRITPRPESAAGRGGDAPGTDARAAAVPVAAEAVAVAASPEGTAAPTTPAGPSTDLPLRTLAQEIGRVARPLAAEGASLLAGPTSDAPPALRRDVEVRLSAPEFGVVRLRMRLNGSSLELRLRTDDAATLTLLAERRTELERAISEAGVDAKVVDVSRTATSATTAASPSPSNGQSSPSDGGRGDGQPFEQRSSPDRNDRRPPFDRPTHGPTPDEDPTSRAGTRPGTLFV